VSSTDHLRRRRPMLLAGALVVGTTLVLGGCTSVRNDLGTTNSGCYVAIPAAAEAVGHAGHLQGVRLVNVSSLRSRESPLYAAAVAAPGPTVKRVCLVAFTGHFEAATVSSPIGEETGRMAVVELEYPDNRLLATLLIAHPPFPFGHSHMAGF
jgi:hypothetical protein